MGVHGGAYDPSILLSANVASITGGTNTVTSYTDSSGNAWRVYTFLESGNFTTDVVSKCDILAVAGGGGGGCWVAGGGGAGGMIVRPGKILSPDTYTITIGAGGTGHYNPGSYAGMPNGSDGDNTTALGLTAIGGGMGSAWTQTHSGNGGSGGGGSNSGANGSANQDEQSGDSGTYGFGNDGGGTSGANSAHGETGGGGAGAAGSNTDGGIGKTNDYRTGANVYYAGGGAAGVHNPGYGIGQGGAGGGGDGTNASMVTGENGTANTGGGAGGGGNTGGSASRGGNGGSGIVVVRLGAV